MKPFVILLMLPVELAMAEIQFDALHGSSVPQPSKP
jgi:hypothetical protein